MPDKSSSERIIRSADRYATPDYRQYGYGIPDAWKAYTMKMPEGMETVKGYGLPVTGQKILRDGQIYLMYQGQMYNVQGTRIK